MHVVPLLLLLLLITIIIVRCVISYRKRLIAVLHHPPLFSFFISVFAQIENEKEKLFAHVVVVGTAAASIAAAIKMQ